LLIQPIVENALRHGLENKVIGGLLYIKSEMKSNMLIIHVIDNGCGIEENKIQEILSYDNKMSDNKVHIGIKNTHERIVNYSDKRYGITIKSRLGKYTKVTLHLPISY
jgi:sensor histidine kinase YesM